MTRSFISLGRFFISKAEIESFMNDNISIIGIRQKEDALKWLGNYLNYKGTHDVIVFIDYDTFSTWQCYLQDWNELIIFNYIDFFENL